MIGPVGALAEDSPLNRNQQRSGEHCECGAGYDR